MSKIIITVIQDPERGERDGLREYRDGPLVFRSGRAMEKMRGNSGPFIVDLPERCHDLQESDERINFVANSAKT